MTLLTPRGGEASMRQKRSLKTIAVLIAFAAIIAAGMISSARLVRAHDDEGDDESEEARIRRGLAIAPVHLNLEDKDPNLVGLGSYWVNAVADCNGCHSAGPDTEYIVPKGNPYLLSPPFSGKQQINPATYVGGGRDFGPFPGPPFPSIPHLYSRNLTPDHTGLPVGRTFEEFRDIMRHGTDFDHLHPNCMEGPGHPPNCLVAPFNGDLLQVMPWPVYENMTGQDLRAIYEYLKAVPCNPGPNIEGAPYLQNICD
jgi:hypothetical protein